MGKLKFDLNIDIDEDIMQEVEEVITDSEFAQYLLSHTTNFGSAAFILQILLNAVDGYKGND